MEQAEYPAMSGSNTICTATVLIEKGLVPVTEPITELVLEAPAGLIKITAEVRDGRAMSIGFENVPAFALALDQPVEVPQVGTVTVDVAWGGMFYALVEAEALGLAITPDEGRDIVRLGEMVKAAAREQIPAVHPDRTQSGGDHDHRADRAAHRARRTRQEHGGRLVRGAGLVASRVVHRRAGPIPVRDRHLRPDGGPPRPRASCPSARTTSTRASWARPGPAICCARRRSALSARSFRASPAAPGSPGTAEFVVADDDPFPNGFTVGDMWGRTPEVDLD